MANPWPQPQARHGRAALPGTECRVVDPDQPSVDVPAGERGELIVRGPQVFQGYYGKPEATEEVFVDGWFRTGDIVQIDDDGFVRIVDRIKELIITGGFNVAPTEVENALRQHPHVVDAAVVGLPSEHPAKRSSRRSSSTAPETSTWIRSASSPAASSRPTRCRAASTSSTSSPILIGKVLRRQVRESRDAHTPRRLTCVSPRRDRARERGGPLLDEDAELRRVDDPDAEFLRLRELRARPGPAATKSVFFETLDAALPPAAMIASCAPSACSRRAIRSRRP
jgi:acyl-CoA synthetase (AMP-forming)/AMP-acid ligase II